jgi:hypothetical protein
MEAESQPDTAAVNVGSEQTDSSLLTLMEVIRSSVGQSMVLIRVGCLRIALS